MTTEKFANLAESTLAAPYTAGGASITVVSAALFPTTGVFRVAIGNAGRTIFRVNSVAGAVFTGVAEAFDANAATAQTVKLVGTRGSIERMLQSPESGEARSPSGSLAVDFYGPITKLTPLDQSGWTWVNQGVAVLTQANGIVNIHTDGSGAGSDVHIRKTGYASPITVTALITFWPADGVDSEGSGANWFGLCFRDSGTGAFMSFVLDRDRNINIMRYTNATTFANLLVQRIPGYNGLPIWLRVFDDGANFVWSYSMDGVNFIQFFATGRTLGGFYTPNEFGFAINAQGLLAAGDVAGSILSWVAA